MMIDFALDAERNEGKTPHDETYQACLLRFRPILMTRHAAVLGALLLMRDRAGAELRHPLGISNVGDLLVGQVLTLLLRRLTTGRRAADAAEIIVSLDLVHRGSRKTSPKRRDAAGAGEIAAQARTKQAQLHRARVGLGGCSRRGGQQECGGEESVHRDSEQDRCCNVMHVPRHGRFL
jgi:hypothetical protein